MSNIVQNSTIFYKYWISDLLYQYQYLNYFTNSVKFWKNAYNIMHWRVVWSWYFNYVYLLQWIIHYPSQYCKNAAQMAATLIAGMSCPSWQWHRAGYSWSPVWTRPKAPLCCDLGCCSQTVVVIKLRRTSAFIVQAALRLQSCGAAWHCLMQNKDSRLQQMKIVSLSWAQMNKF